MCHNCGIDTVYWPQPGALFDTGNADYDKIMPTWRLELRSINYGTNAEGHDRA